MLVFPLSFVVLAIDDWWANPTPYVREVSVNDPIIDEHPAEDIHGGSKTMSDKVSWIINIPQPENYDTSLWYVLALIQIAINWTLWILSLVALIYMIYCGFLVFSSGSGDTNATKGKKWIKTAAIALAWIGLSWLIISVIIWLINNIV